MLDFPNCRWFRLEAYGAFMGPLYGLAYGLESVTWSSSIEANLYQFCRCVLWRWALHWVLCPLCCVQPGAPADLYTSSSQVLPSWYRPSLFGSLSSRRSVLWTSRKHRWIWLRESKPFGPKPLEGHDMRLEDRPWQCVTATSQHRHEGNPQWPVVHRPFEQTPEYSQCWL